MAVKYVDEVVKGFNEKVRNNMEGQNVRSITYQEKLTIGESIEKIVKNALKGVDQRQINDLPSGDGRISRVLREADTIIFPDIHGRLDLFVHELFVANLIDKYGNFKGNKKKVTILGDMIDNGPYSTETLIYLLSLKKQFEEKGGKLVLLIGNHEAYKTMQKYDRFSNIKNEDVIREIILQCIKDGRLQLSDAENKRNFILTHAGIEKSRLKQAVELYIGTGEKIPKKKEKLSSKDIYDFMKKNNISLEKIAKFMNDMAKKDPKFTSSFLARVSDKKKTTKRFMDNKKATY